jgi:hypothetical protein
VKEPHFSPGTNLNPRTLMAKEGVTGVDRAVKIYNTGVVEGQLTLSRGYDWADTMANCEDAVGSIAFWGQIATHLSSMEYRGATETGYFNKLFNLPDWHGSRWDRQSARFLRGAREGRFSNEPVVVSIASQRKQDVFREYSAGKFSLKIFLFAYTILYGRGWGRLIIVSHIFYTFCQRHSCILNIQCINIH